VAGRLIRDAGVLYSMMPVIDTLRELLEADTLVGELLVPERLGLLPDGDDGVIRPGER